MQFLSLVLFLAFCGLSLSAVPPMGWSSYCASETFYESCSPTDCSADSIMKSANSLAKGYLQAGYDHIIIEDCWADSHRDSQQNLKAKSSFLGKNYKSMGDFIQALKAKGFKVGLYTSAFNQTCSSGAAGSFGHWDQDAATFVSWGVDYVKMEWCSSENKYSGISIQDIYKAMSKALKSKSSSIFFALKENIDSSNKDTPWEWASSGVADSWSIAANHLPWFYRPVESAGETLDVIEALSGKSSYAKQGFNDPDLILPQLYKKQVQTEMAIWSISNSPLIFSFDPNNEDYKKFILNSGVIAVNQDKLGKAGDKHRTDGKLEIWTKPLADGSVAVVVYNSEVDTFTSGNHSTTIKFTELGFSDSTTAHVINLWDSQSQTFTGSFDAWALSEEAHFFKVTPFQPVTTTGSSSTSGSSSSTTGSSTSTTGSSTSTTGSSTSTTGSSTTGHSTTGHATTGKATTGHHSTTGHHGSAGSLAPLIGFVLAIFALLA